MEAFSQECSHVERALEAFMKKLILGLTASIIAGSAIGLSPKLIQANGSSADSESASYADMIVRTAINSGAAYTGGQLADYQVVHGDASTSTINAFTTYTADAAAWTGSLGADTDNANCVQWKLNSQSNDGVIAAITAKADLTITITKTANGGWLDPAHLGIYKKAVGGVVSTIKDIELSSSTSLADFGGDYDLATGETLYYQFIFQWTSWRNMQDLPSFLFTKKAGEASSSSTPESSSSSSSESTPDYSTLTTVDLNALADEVVKANGDDLALKDMAAGIYQGNVSSNNVAKFTSYTYSSSDQTSLLSKEGTFGGTDMAAVEGWRLKTTLSSSPIIRITATSDMKLTIAHPQITEGWVDADTGIYFGLYMKSGSNLYKQWTREVNSLPQAADVYGGSLMLKSGDVAYYVFGSTIANERNVNVIPTFTSDSSAYDETVRNSQMHLSSDSENMWDAITDCINNSYNDVDYPLASIGFYHGSMKQMEKFTYHEGDGSGTAADALWDSEQKRVGFQRWQFQCSDGDDAIIKVTAKEKQEISITHTAIWADAWSATNSVVRYYAVDTDGTKVILKTYPITTGSKANDFGMVVSLDAGQSLYLDYYTIDGNWYSVNLAPTYHFSTTDYDASALPDFQTIRDLETLKTAEKKKITDLVASLSETDYSLDNWAQISNIENEALASIDEAQDADTVKSISAKALSDIDAISTLAEEQEELNVYKSQKTEELETFFSSLKENDYTPEDWAAIVKLYEATKKAVASATSKSAVNSLVTTFKANVNKIEKHPQSASNPGLVWGIVGGSVAAVVVLGLVAFFVIRSKKHKKA
jgi:hypothetical protein